MATLHVSLPDDVMERLRQLSRTTDVPLARIVRRAVLELLNEADMGHGPSALLSRGTARPRSDPLARSVEPRFKR